MKKDKKGTLIVLDSIIECLRSERRPGDFIRCWVRICKRFNPNAERDIRNAYIEYLVYAKEVINDADEQEVQLKESKNNTLNVLDSIIGWLRTDFPADHYITSWVCVSKEIENPERHIRNIYASCLKCARDVIDTLVEED